MISALIALSTQLLTYLPINSACPYTYRATICHWGSDIVVPAGTCQQAGTFVENPINLRFDPPLGNNDLTFFAKRRVPSAFNAKPSTVIGLAFQTHDMRRSPRAFHPWAYSVIERHCMDRVSFLGFPPKGSAD